MKTVALVGAGATVASALEAEASENVIPPLDATFFQLAHELELTGLTTVNRYMLRHHGMKIDKNSRTSMEEVFNYIFGDVHGGVTGDEPEEGLKALWFLIRMYNESIAKTTNQLPGDSAFGVYGLLQNLISFDHSLQLAFVTFNQDLMIEKALAKINKGAKGKNIPFSIDKCYGLDFARFVGVSGWKEFAEGETDSVKILKLHGSLNWQYFVRSEKDPKTFLRMPKTDDLTCTKAEKLLLYAKYRPRGRSRSGKLVPVVVPPVYEKSTLYEPLLAPLRKQAEAVLQKAERIVIFGYSFPQADFLARSLLRRAMYKNNSVRDLVIINTDPRVCAEAASICHSDYIRYAETVPSVSFGSPLRPRKKLRHSR